MLLHTLLLLVFKNRRKPLVYLGCAMGTKCAPSYVNMFVGIFEEKFIYPLLNNMTRLYLRFIDDIFIIWTGIETHG